MTILGIYVKFQGCMCMLYEFKIRTNKIIQTEASQPFFFWNHFQWSRPEFYLLGSPPKTSICSIYMISNHNASTLFKWVVDTKLQSAYKPLTNFLDTWVESSLYPDIL